MVKQPYKIIILIIILAFYASLITHKIQLPLANDISRHVKNGELILRGNFEILRSNVYSYTMPNQPFINHHWLSGVIFYLVKEMVGWEGLVIFKIIVLLCAFSLLFFAAIRKSGFWVVSILAIPTIFILMERTQVKPEIFSILFVALFLYLLTTFESHSERIKIFWLIPVQILWVNLHIFFILGPALVGAFLFEKIILQLINGKSIRDNQLIAKTTKLLLFLILACFINPNGISGAIAPLTILANLGFDITENAPLSYLLKTFPLKENFRIIIFGCCLIFLALSFIFSFRNKNIFYLIICAGAAAGAIHMVRLLPFFALVFLPAASANFTSMFLRKGKPNIAFLPFYSHLNKFLPAIYIVILCLIYIASSGKILELKKPGIGLTEQSENASDFFKANSLKGPIFNDYDIGSYLIYSFYPQEKVFTDNRPEAYSPSFFKNTYWPMMTDENTWHQVLEKYQFNVIFFEQYDEALPAIQFMNRRESDSTWALVYADKYAIIFLKNTTENKKTIDANHITLQNVQQRMQPLLKSDDYSDQVAAVDIFNFVGRPDLAMATSFDIVCRWPDKAKTWKVMGQVELTAQGDYTALLAIMFLDKAISEGWKTADTYTSLAEAYLKFGKKDPAEEALKKALKINPEYTQAREMMERYFKKN